MTKARNIADLGSNDVIETTATGVDVTGIVTADSVNVTQTGSTTALRAEKAQTGQIIVAYNGTSVNYLDADTQYFRAGDGTQRMTIASNGDVHLYEDTGTTAKFFWDSSAESLGIGTSSPASDLHISSSTAKITLTDSDVSRTSEIYAASDNLVLAADTGNAGADSHIRFEVDNSEKMRINSSGNVGIGTASPSDTLEIADANSQLRLTDTDDSKFCQFSYSSGKLAIRNNATSVNHLWLNESGNVGIGTASPNAKLDVFDATTSLGSTKNITGRFFRDDGTYNPRLEILHNTSGTTLRHTYSSGAANMMFEIGSTEAMRLDSSGNLLVGTTSNGHISQAHEIRGSSSQGGEAILTVANMAGTAECPALNVVSRDTSTDSSNRFVQFYANYTGTSGSVPMGGIVGNTSGSVQFASISDEREKENIQSVTSVVNKVKQLNVVEFDFINTGDHVNYGFTAQNVETVFPEFVIDNIANAGEEQRKGLAGGMSSGYIAVLTKALQEALTEIDSLKQRVDALENK